MSTDSEVVLGHGMVGLFHYTLTDDAGEVLDSSVGREPMAYLHGFHNIIPGLEKQLEGKGAGVQLRASIPPAEAYGELQGPEAQRVHRRDFPKDIDIVVGASFDVKAKDGRAMTLWVSKVEGAWVWLDANHPLAGKTLHFDVNIVGVRGATDDEKRHGHAHGPDGHHHHH